MKKTVLASVLALTSLAPLAAFASDGTINFTGSVTATTCTVSGGSTISKALPPVSSTTLGAAGNTTGDTAIQISLTGCAGGSATGVRAFFESGTGVNASTGRLINTGTATNVDVQLAMPDNTPIVAGAASGSQGTGPFTALSGGAATLNYKARYYSTGATHTAGNVIASVTYSIEYQ
ncbi:fimbrial protein [Herbaspirillum rhizosphaerae]|uniref:fimbrial protein n=1 Tax=Herbaspirillum rhizosphaerae TaxID=346179 RepID=UPI0009F89D10|nr:fimbrial protein [Herbaspirillum rhizosphaerae]